MRWDELDGRRIAVLGAGVEGQAATRALLERQIVPTVLSESQPDRWDPDAPLRVGPLADAALEQFEVLIKSPGISLYRPEIVGAKAAGCLITSGSAIWFANCPVEQTIAVTGTKGKSTVCSLLAHFARAAGQSVAIGGNFGVPLLSVTDSSLNLAVVELSSYQAADYHGSPTVALLTNLYPEHLDWHGSERQYFTDKLQLFSGKPQHSLARQEEIDMIHEVTGADAVAYDDGSWRIVDGIIYRGDHVLGQLNWGLRGTHNQWNLIAALTALDCLGIDPAPGIASLHRFSALPHRQQVIHQTGSLRFVDDSIATTPHATRAAIEAFSDQPLAAIVGGYDRGLDWSEFAAWLSSRPIARLIIRGANAEQISQAFDGSNQPVSVADQLADAVAAAVAAVGRNGTILMSPGAPSYGEYRNYIERGEAFAGIAAQGAWNDRGSND